jgi:hypothetical protein
LLVAPLAASADARRSSGSGEAGGTADTVDATEVLATLVVQDATVEVRRADTERFREARDGQSLHEGDTVRTDATGRATINYTDESFTRLDVDTTFTVVELTDDAGARHTVGSLEQGRVWNRVEDLGESEAFETEGAGATAAVVGTAYSVWCVTPDECTFTGVVHHMELRWNANLPPTTIGELEYMVVVQGAPGSVSTLTLEQYFADAWIQVNLGIDEFLGYPGPDRFRGVVIVRHGNVVVVGGIPIEVGGIVVTNPPADDPPPEDPPPGDPPGLPPNGFGAGGGTNEGGASFDGGDGHPVGNCMASGAHNKVPGSKPDPSSCLNG